MSRSTPRLIQYLLLAAGIVLLSVYAVARVDSWVSSREALKGFDEALAATSSLEVPRNGVRRDDATVDFSLWSEKRVRDYKKSLLSDTGLARGVLGIDRLRIRVPIFDGTDELVLNRGVGWIAGTARPGDTGNIGIAGHRDGFFRGLKDIVSGDAITLETMQEQATYVVNEIEIVTPDHVEVLRPRGSPSLTLVTCYPFYFIGDAPQRFIVHATLAKRVPREHWTQLAAGAPAP